MSWRGPLVALLAVGVLSTGCGPPEVSAGAAVALQDHVDEVRALAAQGLAGETATALQSLRVTLSELEARGEVTAARAERIRSAADEVATHLPGVAPAAAQQQPATQSAGATPGGGGEGPPPHAPAHGRRGNR